MKKLFLCYFVFLFSLLSIFSAGVIDSIDGFQYLVVARSIYYKGAPTAPPYEYSERKNIHMSVVTGKDGKTYSLTGLGFSLAYLPAVAITDIVYKIYGIDPSVHFPLENDWLIFLTAGFTNAFFGALLGIILFAYFLTLGLSKKQAILMSIISIIATNLFVYTKHSMAHMMFVAFLMLSFLLIKFYSIKGKWWLMSASGLSFGILMITYNPTFILAIPPLFLYYILLIKHHWNKESLNLILKDISVFFIGLFPFILIYNWFESLRTVQQTTNLALIGTRYLVYKVPLSVFFEGIYGQLLSPGRSIFIYSPVLLMIIFFWHKIRKNVYPELFAFTFYSIILVAFYSKAYTIGSPDQGIAALWHGESSWGPRYLTPVIPLGLLVIAGTYRFFSKKVRYFIFYPLVVIGIFIEILGILMPYQTKYFNLQRKFYVNSTEYGAALYSDLLPRYTPILNMSKNVVNLAKNFPNTYDHGKHNVKFYDGIDFPFNVGQERWRAIEGKGYISFDNNQNDFVEELSFGLINHPIAESSSSAKLQFVLNDVNLLETPLELGITERKIIKIPLRKNLVQPEDNKLEIIVNYEDPEVLTKTKQILGLQSFDINSQRQNLESIDVPYVSALGPKIAGVTYQNWGGTNTDPWKAWDIHTQVFERLPDFWWIRNLYYWDIPKVWIVIPFILNLAIFILAAIKLKKEVSR
ncbi:MAG: hypothetical protein ACD_32C00012G0014 [uncultured bacterium]|uniref:Glycosyltransferase RgtA/B/C/D-like domain-containing protein n=1 Tax=Candidatus Daviesbacteria bacterium GW2011_GWC2_40_12 TaxID=1618431 RepID=A0A0G0QZ46_9BACT|nr:MAG: hypothetical protein ACD_32C00012G0014 [uncultured bacterium]KKQ83851.1 MAG: hypothetical protein UT04_C0024G0007 [Candidatus Daviesbacteria bacterium GW2011_GWF2_38_7]KKR17287.1 MAG: hypothetical protein UT45_C0002G0116 [Candidatus Daviesbacteria bacterium GW2011_GWA2_39_33]KKR42686.1 MAG: hypothetical protein UT77_C0001G0137 [Candidatus Daviesbacteria bacterium GW2011_GWC2_40_12]OGE21359.1 MAG: hypothetical protein A2778_04295 [Candidatus Daviesbacteria bacterium RIFCSPHIGHO2_01_FULL_